MKTIIRFTTLLFVLVMLCTDLFGCAFIKQSPSVIEYSDKPEITPSAAPGKPLDFICESNKLIDTDIIEAAVAKSVGNEYPEDISVFNYVLNRELFSRYADTDLKKELVLGAYAAVITSQESYTLPEGLDFRSDDLRLFMNILDADAPEIFHLENEYKYYTSDSIVKSIDFSYSRDASEYYSMLMRLFAQADDITGSKDTDYDTELYIHDRIINKCTYIKDGENVSNAYGALIDGNALCEGYSDAFTLCMFLKGIKCMQLWGTAVNNKGISENHAWNCVLIDDKWYQTDITWDDFKEEESDRSLYAYFNITDDKMYKNHILTESLSGISLPECQSNEYNYHVINGNVVKEGSNYKKEIRRKLDSFVSSKTGDATIILAFESDEQFAEMYDNVESIFGEWANKQVQISSMEYNCIYDTSMGVIQFFIKLNY